MASRAPARAATLPTWPYFEEDEIAAAVNVLRTGKVNYWTGSEGREFEKEFATFTGSKFGVAVMNGTVALELALRSLGVGAGDEVVTTARTFIASASCAAVLGARPVIADVDRDTQNVTAKTISAVLTPKTKAIIAVHLAGWPCEMDAIMALARERGIKVVEDCAQAHGAEFKGRPVGSWGDVAAFSFCQDKIMTLAGEGGLVTTNDESIWRNAWEYKDHGKSWDAVYNRQHAPGFRWLHESFGTNWRLTEVQSAMGRVMLRKLPAWVDKRRKFAGMFSDAFADCAALRLTLPPNDVKHSYYKYYAFVRPERLRSGWTRDRIIDEIVSRGVPCYVGSCSEIYLEKAFPESWRPAQRLPVAKELFETSIMLLVHPTLTAENIERAIEIVRDVTYMAGN
jgi:dTDP-4-amino-4,6-dideoxygalactose transaminase